MLSHVSDAVLSCPCCLVTLCLDCQRHVRYPQYRAMFVINCEVKRDTTARDNKARDNKAAEAATRAADRVFPVFCAECNTEVGVLDNDDVYHFYNVCATGQS